MLGGSRAGEKDEASCAHYAIWQAGRGSRTAIGGAARKARAWIHGRENGGSWRYRSRQPVAHEAPLTHEVVLAARHSDLSRGSGGSPRRGHRSLLRPAPCYSG